MNPQRPFRSRQSTLILVLSLVALLLFGACGGGGDTDTTGDTAAPTDAAQESGSRRAAPTMPVAQFAAVAADVDLTKVAERADEATPEPESEPDLALGESAYGRLCAECHGDAGEGVADKGETITGVALEMAAFDDLLRTGGGYGNEHIFGPTKISDDGIAALYAFVQRLAGD